MTHPQSQNSIHTIMNKAAFLDRDGVINIDLGYVYSKEKIIFNRGIFSFLKFLIKHNFKIFVVTNQSGISKGFYTEKQFWELTEWIDLALLSRGIEITKTYCAPYDPVRDFQSVKYDSYDRKPNPGMILKAQKEFGIDLANSILIGDKISDVQAGISAGVGFNILLSKKKECVDECIYIASSFAKAKKEIEKFTFEKGGAI